MQMVQSENLTTLLVVVPKFATKEWVGGYERLTQFVVPRSSVCLLEEADACLFRVVLFKRVADAFKTAALDAGFQARPPSLHPQRSPSRHTHLSRTREHTGEPFPPHPTSLGFGG